MVATKKAAPKRKAAPKATKPKAATRVTKKVVKKSIDQSDLRVTGGTIAFALLAAAFLVLVIIYYL